MLAKRLHGCLLLLIFLLANVSGSHAETTVDPDSEDGSKRRSLAASSFCVAKQGADQTALQMGLNWACGPGQANCAPIQPGGPCYKQNNLEALASYAYNDYYQKNFATGGSCSFNGTAMTTADPSSGQCVFTGSSMAGGGTPAASAPSGLSPPSTFTPGIAGSPSNSLIPLDGAESLVSRARWAICALLLALPLFFL